MVIVFYIYLQLLYIYKRRRGMRRDEGFITKDQPCVTFSHLLSLLFV